MCELNFYELNEVQPLTNEEEVMKKISYVYSCDFCGVQIEKNKEHPIVVFPNGRHSTSRTLHLCPDCQKAIENLLNANNEFPPEEPEENNTDEEQVE